MDTKINKWPNCSYFTNWKSLEDKISFTVDVLQAGEYEVEIYYTCPEGDTGAELELSFGDSKKTVKVTMLNDPPAVGAKEDRHKRNESYVKDCKPLSMGIIKLDKGKGQLKLRALSKPGNSIIEFRLLTLKRVK